MKRWALFVALSCHAPAVPKAPVPQLAIIDVSLVPMDRERVIEHQTVLVEGDAIVAVGRAGELRPAPNATIVDGRGRYLIPGLADMHFHAYDASRAPLELLVTYGVTTARIPSGTPRLLALRDAIARGTVLGPRLVVASTFFDGEPPTWEGSRSVVTREQAEHAVRASSDYDAIKLYNKLEPASYQAIAEAAARQQIPIFGHVPFHVPLDQALAARQASIEHLTGYSVALERLESPVRGNFDTASRILRFAYADRSRIPALAAATARSGVANCPTLITQWVVNEQRLGRKLAVTGLEWISPRWRAIWQASFQRPPAEDVRAATQQAGTIGLDLQFELVRALAAAGARLLVGTDFPNPGLVPGASVHGELRMLVRAGLRPFQALRAATTDAQSFVARRDLQLLARGARADLVLLDRNPLEAIEHVEAIAGVVLGGRWFDGAALREMRATIAARYRDQPWTQPPNLDANAVQYVIEDNGVVVGAEALTISADRVTSASTTEDERVEQRMRITPAGTVEWSAAITRPEGPSRIQVPAMQSVVPPWSAAFGVAIAAAGAPLEIGERVQLEVMQPDLDAPTLLRAGTLTIERIDDAGSHRVHRMAATIAHGRFTGSIEVRPDGVPSRLEIAWAQRSIRRVIRAR